MERQGEPAELADQLHSFAIRFLRLVREEDRSSGVGPARLSAMSVLAFRDGLTVGDLARIEQVAMPTMSRIVAALGDAGLVARSPHPDDGRSVVLSLTVRGRQLFESARARRLAVADAIVTALSSEEQARLRPILERLAAAVAAG
jgi:DNA-binding MarR family transcriptional regulator